MVSRESKTSPSCVGESAGYLRQVEKIARIARQPFDRRMLGDIALNLARWRHYWLLSPQLRREKQGPAHLQKLQLIYLRTALIMNG
jgi:hypothetical protein